MASTNWTFMLLLLLISCCDAYHWEPYTGDDFPANALYVSYFERDYYYCQVRTPLVFSGTVSSVERTCVVANVWEVDLEEYDEYEILVLDDGDDPSFVYSETATPPDNAVPCEDSQLPACYLGHSVYGDGICWEMIGKADPEARAVFYATPSSPTRRFQECPFVMFLTM